MKSATKMILIGVSILFTTALVFYASFSFTQMKKVEMSTNETTNRYLSNLLTSSLPDVSGTVFSGTEAINYVKKFGDTYLIEVVDSELGTSHIYNNVNDSINAINRQKAYECALKYTDSAGGLVIADDKSLATIISFTTVNSISSPGSLDLSGLAGLLAGTEFQVADDATSQDLINSFIAYIKELQKQNADLKDSTPYEVVSGQLLTGTTEIDFVPTDVIVFEDSYDDTGNAFYLNLATVFDLSDAESNSDGFLKKITVKESTVGSESKQAVVCLQFDLDGVCKRCWIENEFESSVPLYYKCVRAVKE